MGPLTWRCVALVLVIVVAARGAPSTTVVYAAGTTGRTGRSGGGPCGAREDPCLSLQSAMHAVEEDIKNADTLLVQYEVVLLSGRFAGADNRCLSFSPSKPVNITLRGSSGSTIDCEEEDGLFCAAPLHVVVNISLIGLNVSNCVSSTLPGIVAVAKNGTLEVEQCSFNACGSRAYTSGGLFRVPSGCTFSLRSSSFRRCHGYSGGVLWAEGAQGFVENTTFESGWVGVRSLDGNYDYVGTRGGALDVSGGRLEVRSSVFQNNTCIGVYQPRQGGFPDAFAGAGCALYTELSTVHIYDCLFEDQKMLDPCHNSDGCGGGSGGGTAMCALQGNTTIVRTVFRRNVQAYQSHSLGALGGAIYFIEPGLGTDTMTLDSCELVQNVAQLGGALLGWISLTNCTLRENVAFESGGAALLSFRHDVLLVNTTFAGNMAGRNGGAIGVQGYVNFAHDQRDMEFVTFSNNSAGGRGGAIWFERTPNSWMFPFYTCDFSYNSAGSEGGAIYLGGLGTVTLSGGNFSHNQADRGGVVYADDSAVLILEPFLPVTMEYNHARFGGSIAIAGLAHLIPYYGPHSVTFRGGSAQFGGAIGINSSTYLDEIYQNSGDCAYAVITGQPSMVFADNHARVAGGQMFLSRRPTITCWNQMVGTNDNWVLKNNTAGSYGPNLATGVFSIKADGSAVAKPNLPFDVDFALSDGADNHVAGPLFDPLIWVASSSSGSNVAGTALGIVEHVDEGGVVQAHDLRLVGLVGHTYNLTLTTIPARDPIVIAVTLLQCPAGYNNVMQGGHPSCIPCPAGQYNLIGDGVCHTCNPETTTCVGAQVRALSGYWVGNGTGSTVDVYECLSGMCVDGACAAHHIVGSPLCGACEEGYYPWHGYCTHCPSGVNWGAVALVVAAALTYVVLQTFYLPMGSNGAIKIFFYFVQIIPFLVPRSTMGGVMDFFSFRYNIRACLFAASPVTRSMFDIISPLAVFVLLGLVFVVNTCYRRVVSSKAQPQYTALVSINEAAPPVAPPSVGSRFVRTCVLLVLFTSTSVGSAASSYLACRKVGTASVNAYSPGMRCDGEGYKRSIPVAVVALGSSQVFVFAAVAAMLFKGRAGLSNAADESSPLMQCLTSSYNNANKFWELVVLARRTAAVMVYTLLFANPLDRGLALLLLQITVLVVHLLRRPYDLPVHNTAETVALASLVGVSVLSLSSQHVVSLEIISVMTGVAAGTVSVLLLYPLLVRAYTTALPRADDRSAFTTP